MTLRTAVVGGGTVSEKHLAGLERNPRTELVAICDVDEDTAGGIAEDYDIQAYFDVEEMLDDIELDWVHLCTPVQSHLPIAKLVIEAGVPVQIEKPITETYEEFEELAAHAERHGVTVSEIHNHNFSPAVRTATKKIQEGELGALRGVDVIYTGLSRPDDANRGPWNFELAGGEYEEGLPHPIYLTLRTGGYPRSEADVTATATLFDDYDQDFEYDTAQLQYVTDDGVLCTTKMLGGTRPVRQILIHGEEKSLTVDLVSQTLVEHDRDYQASSVNRGLNNVDHVVDRVTETVKNVRSMLRDNRNDDWDTARLSNPHYYQHDAESRALESGGEMPVPLSESRWTMYLMEAVRDAARQTDRRDAQPVEAGIEQDAE